MTQSIEAYFCDWEGEVFGFGYGSGEPYTLPALRTFLELCDGENGSYDYERLEQELSPVVAWLLINALSKHPAGIINYGTSPRRGWLDPNGHRLREFVLSKTAEELVDIVCSPKEEPHHCGPRICNCSIPRGYDPAAVCPNPFWPR